MHKATQGTMRDKRSTGSLIASEMNLGMAQASACPPEAAAGARQCSLLDTGQLWTVQLLHPQPGAVAGRRAACRAVLAGTKVDAKAQTVPDKTDWQALKLQQANASHKGRQCAPQLPSLQHRLGQHMRTSMTHAAAGNQESAFILQPRAGWWQPLHMLCSETPHRQQGRILASSKPAAPA